ncbi:hypothetical protein ACS0TY_012874 [Phlomoides rotata]
MQFQGEATTPTPTLQAAAQNLRPALAFHSPPAAQNIHVPPSRVGLLSVGLRIIQQDGSKALFFGVSATVLQQTLYSTTRMGLYDILKTK